MKQRLLQRIVLYSGLSVAALTFIFYRLAIRLLELLAMKYPA